MSNHTPEPWFDDRATHDEPYQNIKILGDENRGICWLWIDDAPVDDWNSEQRANASRIVTCVNACAGMEDPVAEIDELKRQRDELLDSLRSAVETIEWMHGCSSPASDEVEEAIREGNATIAKAKGGAA